MKKFLIALMVVLTITCFSGFAFATQPLITDTAVTEGKGNVKFEVGGNYTYNDNNNTETKVWAVPGTLSIGMLNNVDFIVEDTYYNIDLDKGETISEMGDVSLKLKVQIINSDGWMVALRPEVTLPSGDAEKGTGNDDETFGSTLLVTKQIGAILTTANIGYHTRDNINFSNDGNNDGVFMASLAGEIAIVENWKAVGEIGVWDNYGYGTGGVVWSIAKYADFSIAARTGPNVDVTGLTGLTFRF
jgi:hypothetical protein